MNNTTSILRLLLLTLVFANQAVAQSQPMAFEHIKVAFELRGPSGATVTETDLRGNHVLLAFGFTRCAHICPMLVANMAAALKVADQPSLGVFISVDTERDTPSVTHQYATGFHPSFMGLSGNHEQIRQAANNFGVSFVVTKSQKAYTVEHTSDIFLLNPEGKLIDVFALNTPPREIVKAMQQATPR